MGKIDDLRRRLFRPKEAFGERTGEPELAPSEATGPHARAGDEEDPEIVRMRALETRRRVRKALFWTGLGFIVVVGAGLTVLFLWLGSSGGVSERNIDLEVLAPQKIAAGEKV